jgi:hypothetical protein
MRWGILKNGPPSVNRRRRQEGLKRLADEQDAA